MMQVRTIIIIISVIMIIPVGIGVYYFNLFFVSGADAFFDCRITSTADMYGNKIQNITTFFTPTFNMTPYPKSTICPIEMPETIEDCKKLYQAYAALLKEDRRYYSEYQIVRCGIKITCEQTYNVGRSMADADPNITIIPYEQFEQRFCKDGIVPGVGKFSDSEDKLR